MVGAGADDLILLCARTFLGPGLRAAIGRTDVRALPNRDAAGGCRDDRRRRGRRSDLALQPEQPDGGDDSRRRARRARALAPRRGGRRGRGVRRVRRRVGRAVARRDAQPGRHPHALEGLRLRRAPRRLCRRGAGDRGAARGAAGAGADRGAGGADRGGSAREPSLRPRTDARRARARPLGARRRRLGRPRGRRELRVASDRRARRRAPRGRGPDRTSLSRRGSGSRCAARPRTTSSCARSEPSRVRRRTLGHRDPYHHRDGAPRSRSTWTEPAGRTSRRGSASWITSSP